MDKVRTSAFTSTYCCSKYSEQVKMTHLVLLHAFDKDVDDFNKQGRDKEDDFILKRMWMKCVTSHYVNSVCRLFLPLSLFCSLLSPRHYCRGKIPSLLLVVKGGTWSNPKPRL
jgi:hypothetical protein